MTWIKICGTTNLEDALTAVEAGADALGFVFCEKSPRNVVVETAREIVAQLPEKVEKIGVFPDQSAGTAVDIALWLGLTALQLYPLTSLGISLEPQAAMCVGQMKVFWALPASMFLEPGSRWVPSGKRSPGCPAILLDSGTFQQPGGTGTSFDWEKTAPFVAMMSQEADVVIAGGLNPTNVAEAIRILKPWGVDVASGVEARPGKKDPDKVRAFVQAVRQTDKSA